MHFVLLLIFAFTVKGDSDESKYVDLLPEDEKEEFIQNVARRIIKNVEAKEVANKSSVEIPDEELKEHEAFVKKILREESSIIRRNREEKAKEKDAEDDVSVKSIENLKEIQRVGSIDLTLRSGRKKRRDNGQSSEISVEVITENVIIKTKNFGSGNKTDEKAKNSDYVQSSKEDIEVRHIERPITEHFEVITNNLEVGKTNISVDRNETVKNNENITVKSSQDKVNEKTVKRRAIDNTILIETVNSNEIKANDTSLNQTEFVSTSKEYQPTIMDNFDVEKVDGSEETTNQTTETSTSEGTTTQLTTVNFTTVDVTTVNDTTVNSTSESQGNETTEYNQFTQVIYDSELEPESDRDCKDETVNDDVKASSNASDVEQTTIKRYLRSNDYDIVTDGAGINYSGDSMDTLEMSIETVSDKVIESTVQSITIKPGPDKISDTMILGTRNENNKITGITELPFMMGGSNETGKVTVSSTTKSNNDISSETVPSNTDKSKESSDVTSTAGPDMNNKNISGIPKDVEQPISTVEYQNERLKAGLISRTRLDIVNDTKTDQVKEIKNKDLVDITNRNELKNDTIPLDESTVTDYNESKDTILTTTGSIMTTIYTLKPTLTTSNRDANKNKGAKKNGIYKNKATIKTVKNKNYKSNLVADKAVDMLKDSLLLVKDIKKENDLFKGLKNEYNRQILIKKNNYQVFEIPADKPPFIKDPVAITEQPYYVPVYNYSPNKAYFNAQNRLGPNADDANDVNLMEKEFDTVEADDKEYDNNDQKSYEADFGTFKDRPSFDNDYDFDEEDDRRKKFGNQRLHLKLSGNNVSQPVKLPVKLPVVIRQPVFKENNFNPNDYVDIHYDNRISDDEQGSRNGDWIFPEMDDPLHPYHSIRERNLKDHMRAVRNILYANKLFSDPYSPIEKHIETTTEAKIKENVTDPKYYRIGEQKRGIALDYYFGRMKLDESSEENHKKVGYFKRHNETKDLYINNELFHNNLVKLINTIKYKDEVYVNDELTATPHADLVDERLEMPQEPVVRKLADKITIINMNDEADVYDILETLEEFNLTLKKEDDSLNVYARVLKDMVHLESDALQQYDWLGTTVDLQSALEKLLRLIEGVQSVEQIHPSDLELLKYVVFLHKFSKELGESKILADELRKKQMLPRNRRKKKRLLNEKGLLHRVWLLRKKRSAYREESNLENFNDFVIDLQDALYELHEAIRNIAKISTYRKQNWFKNIKELYLTDDKSCMTLLLHLSATRLFGLIEDSARSNLEDDFKSYVRNNRKDTMTTVEEMLFVIRILDYIKRFE